MDVLAWLSDPATHGLPPEARVEVHETPGCRVFLAGDRAIKVKKPVDLGFLDFSTLAKRRATMEQELALNRRTAPAYYLSIAQITRDAAGRLAFDGAGEAVEVALVMKRFPQDRLLSRVAERDGISDAHAEALGDSIAAFHWATPPADVSGVASMRKHAGVNAGSLRDNPQVFAPGAAEDLIAATERSIDAYADLMEERSRAGYVRRLHGDLHLENIFLDETGRPTPFDAIEFDESLAMIDVLLDLAFPLMDLIYRDQRRAANRVLNVWLDRMAREEKDERWLALGLAGASGLAILPLCLSGRAAVRAHVRARLSTVLAGEAGAKAAREARSYLALARAWLDPPPPRLLAVGGRSGTGKSTLARDLAPGLGGPCGAVVIRTDEVRKRLLGVGPLEPLPPSAYAPESHARIYDACFALAERALRAGAAVILDAAFLDADERAAARAVASATGVTLTGLWLEAPADVLLARVARRTADASDADARVVRGQLGRDVGAIDWHTVDASGSPEDALRAAQEILAQA
jgi:aminoglycoside phosphotransferase family enzyme/predicted kinase